MIERAPEFYKDRVECYNLYAYLKEVKPDIINKIEENYYYWDKVKYIKIIAGKLPIDSEKVWKSIYLHRKFKNYSFGKEKVISFKIGTSTYLNQKLHYLDFNFGAGLQKEKLLTELEKQQYLKNALMEEAVFSSMIEGATTTRIKAKEMLRKSKKPRDKSEQMILSNYKTIQFISENKQEDISIEKLFDLHRLVTENTLDEEDIGNFRNNNDIKVYNELTGEIVHTPPSFEELNELMKSFCEFFNHNPKEDFIHPIVKASILHFLVGYIHPFVDGNGRTARAIFYWYLLKNGYWLTEYLSISRVIMKTKVQYEKAYLYTEIDDMDVTYFIHYQVKVLMRAFEELKEYVAKKKKDENKLLKFLQVEDINERQAEILFKIKKKSNKFFTVKEIENTYGITNQTARTDLEELVSRGFLKKIPINKKSFNYWKGNLFDTIFM